MKKSIILIALIWMVGVFNSSASNKVELPLRFDFYYTYEEMVEAMKLLHNEYPNLTELEVVGQSEENRDIYALTIYNKKLGDKLSRPGVYVDGNIHGNEIQAGEVCLYLAHKLLADYGKNEKITAVVNKNTWYIIPMVNVDGRYHFFADAGTPSNNRGLRIPKDDDRDGLFDEDFNDDLDGDGNICMMRKKDPNGMYKSDPKDPRVLIPVKPGEKGEWTLLGEEGIDNDKDGLMNEDSEGYVDPNRNWGYYWAPNYVQIGSGNYPFSGKGTRAIGQWLLSHNNIIMAYAFHNMGGMFLRGPSLKSMGKYHPKDVATYDYLGENNEKIVPGYRYLVSWKDLYSTYGDFGEYIENLIGAYTFIGELSLGNAETYNGKALYENPNGDDFFRNDPESDRQKLQFNDHVAQGELFKEWTKFDHPDYGEIEIGGWVKMSRRLPHPFMLQDMVHRVSSAVLFSAEQTPEVKMEVFEKTKLKNGLYKVRIRLSNDKAMPSITYQSVRHGLYPKDQLTVKGSNAKVILGGEIKDKYLDKVTYKEFKPEIQFCQVPAFGAIEYEFMISGSGKVIIDFKSRKAADKKLEIDL